MVSLRPGAEEPFASRTRAITHEELFARGADLVKEEIARLSAAKKKPPPPAVTPQALPPAAPSKAPPPVTSA